jgi:putative ABC transport system permease protein
MGPRLMMNLADIAAAEVVQPGSRVQYAYLFAGDRCVAVWRAVEAALVPGQRFERWRPAASRARAVGPSLLMLAGSLGEVTASLAIMVSRCTTPCRRYPEDVGLTAGAIRGVYAGNLLPLALAGIGLGSRPALQAAVFAVPETWSRWSCREGAAWLGAGTGARCLGSRQRRCSHGGRFALGVLARAHAGVWRGGVSQGPAAPALPPHWYMGLAAQPAGARLPGG